MARSHRRTGWADTAPRSRSAILLENCRAGPEDPRPADPVGARVAQERGDPDSPSYACSRWGQSG